MTATRELGRSGLHVAPIAFAGNVFGWSADEKASFALLDAFVDAGFNLVDTADVYSAWVPGNQGGESETILGRWFKHSGKRDKVVLATKVAKWSEHPGLSADTITAAVEDSLRRLQTDVIDLYQAHEDDESTPLESTLAAFGRLIEQGKVRAIGASNYSAERLRDALKVSADYKLPRYETLQPEYNLYDRGQSVVDKYVNPRGLRILTALDDVASTHGVSPSQVAIAWLIARPGITAPIVSATSVEQLKDVLAAANVALSAQDVQQLDAASAEQA